MVEAECEESHQVGVDRTYESPSKSNHTTERVHNKKFEEITKTVVCDNSKNHIMRVFWIITTTKGTRRRGIASTRATPVHLAGNRRKKQQQNKNQQTLNRHNELKELIVEKGIKFTRRRYKRIHRRSDLLKHSFTSRDRGTTKKDFLRNGMRITTPDPSNHNQPILLP